MTTATQITATQNDDWGFWGTMDEQATAAWPLAMTAVSDATGQPLGSVRTFLDSRHGSHFADDVQNALYRGQTLADAINAATQQWMGWTIVRRTSKDYGIPRGMPYLTGFVVHCETPEAALRRVRPRQAVGLQLQTPGVLPAQRAHGSQRDARSLPRPAAVDRKSRADLESGPDPRALGDRHA